MIYIFLTALLWGITNPFIKHYTAGFAQNEDSKEQRGFWGDIKFLLSRPKYVVAQATNLSGTVFFHLALVDTPVSIASAVANGLTLAITCAVSAWVVGDTRLSARGVLGLVMVIVGLALCIYDTELRKSS